MSKKIVILNASPHKKGNTVLLCEAFAEGAQSAGYEVMRFDLQQMQIAPCLGCMQGGKDPAHPCVQKDDMDKIYPAFKEAEYVVLASPLHYWRMAGPMGVAFDRLFALAEEAGNLTGPAKKSILLMTGGSDSPENWKFADEYYQLLVRNLAWTDCGKILVGGVFPPGAIADNPALEQARKLGASL